jgi:hypothetical protein
MTRDAGMSEQVIWPDQTDCGGLPVDPDVLLKSRRSKLVVRMATWLRDEEAAGSNPATSTSSEGMIAPGTLTANFPAKRPGTCQEDRSDVGASSAWPSVRWHRMQHESREKVQR